MNHARFALGALLLNLAVLVLSATPLYAQPSPPKASPTSTATPASRSDALTCELHVANNRSRTKIPYDLILIARGLHSQQLQSLQKDGPFFT